MRHDDTVAALRRRSVETRDAPVGALAPANRRPIKPIRWWIIAVMVAFVVAGTVAVLFWLLSEANKIVDPDAKAKARIEAIRTGLTVGAGGGGAIVLALAARRQWLNEHEAIRQDEADKYNRFDAEEKRITDLYTKAVDQVGSEKAAVRLGGLYALERLAQDNAAHRQTIVDVLCAYLRMPYGPPNDEDSDESLDREELEVRLTVQRMLTRHACPTVYLGEGSRSPNPAYWGELDLNLDKAFLMDFSMEDCRVKSATISGARLMGDYVNMTHLTSTGHLTLRGTRFFGTADFYSLRSPIADFEGCRFYGIASFVQREPKSSEEENEVLLMEGSRFYGKVTIRGGQTGPAYGEPEF